MDHRKEEAFEAHLINVINSYTEGESNLDDVIDAADRLMCYKANIGIDYKRLEHNPREKAFHDQWLKENAPLPYVNNGHGILQDLFIERPGPPHYFGARKILEEISPRDRMIAATIIQWLGTNCGMGFLSEALARFGGRIVYDKK